MGPRTRNGISRRLRDIAVLVQSNLVFLTFTDLCLQGQTVSDYHPLFLSLGYTIHICFFNELKLFLDAFATISMIRKLMVQCYLF